MTQLLNMSVPYMLGAIQARGFIVHINNYLGLRFGRLEVAERLPAKSKTDTNARWLCRCDCGRAAVVYGQDLKRGRTKSCGCLQAEVRMQHGMAHLPVYKVWSSMLQRCENPKSQAWPNYGGRGIEVSKEWHDFKNFIADMGDRPKGYSIEREDNDGNYCKYNCTWVVTKVQNNNTRRNRVIEFNGEKRTLAEWSEKIGINWYSLRNRLDILGWSVEKTLGTLPKETVGVKHSYKGKTQTLQAWSDETGIGYETLKKRINKLNWSIDEALTTPVSKKGIN